MVYGGRMSEYDWRDAEAFKVQIDSLKEQLEDERLAALDAASYSHMYREKAHALEVALAEIANVRHTYTHITLDDWRNIALLQETWAKKALKEALYE